MKHMFNTGCAAFALTSLMLGATEVHSSPSAAAVIKEAEADAANATKALAKRKPDAAVHFAQLAVQLRPQDATYRALLGKAYLATGRFFSARQAFADALELDPGIAGAVALNLALATTATGDFAAAQTVLDTHAAKIGASDLGLAVALAGNPAAGVDILLAAARAPGADAKIRQNLALALALAGRWPDARQVALADLSPADADARIMQWANFARPAAASDQVSALLGVTPVADAGLPVQLALTSAPIHMAEAPVAEQVAVQDVVPAVPPLAKAEAAPVAVATIKAAPAVFGSAIGNVTFAERREVVQVLPARRIAATIRAIKPSAPVARLAAPARKAVTTISYAKGDFQVQLGAYTNADMARWGWERASRRFAALAGTVPATMASGNGLIRLSVGGFAREDAGRLCRSVRSKGGACFVRMKETDRMASWVIPNRVQMASR